MLIKFKSKAAAEFIMYKEHARPILELLGKDIDRGIITHAETQNAINTIEAAVQDSRAHPVSQQVTQDISIHPQPDNNGNHGHGAAEPVSFSSRAYPLLQMLRAANAQGNDVVWGV